MAVVGVSMNAGRWFIAAYLALAVAVTVGLALGFANDMKIEAARKERIIQINAINRAQCHSLQNLYDTLRRSIAESDTSIDEIVYYKEHPGEAALAHARNARTIREFNRPPCPADFVVPD